MERVKTFRPKLVILFFLAILGFFAYRLYVLQVFETGGLPADNVTYYVTQTRVKAARGDILDRNGNVLVGNRASYDLVINHYVLTNSENPNAALYSLVKLCEELGIEYTEHFPVTAASISRHLSVLKDADLIRDTREGKFIFYEINTSVLEETMLWIADLKGDNENDQE